MQSVVEFLEKLEGANRELFMVLHDICEQDFSLVPKLRYKIPFYYGNSWVCYLNPIKKGGLELCFIRGKSLGLPFLEAKGRKQVRGISIYQIDDEELNRVHQALSTAVDLDRNESYPRK
jgi:hypothetical protein